jgi:hypothetical protein
MKNQCAINAKGGYMKKVASLLLFSSLIIFSSLAEAVDVDILKMIKIINTDELKKLYDAKADMLLINNLSPIEFAEEHIKDSVNIPFMLLKTGKAKLPDNKDKMLVFYCKGPR